MNNPQDKTQIPVAACPVSVAYRRTGRTWHATALQFDLVGTGRTRETAYEELRGIVELYLRKISLPRLQPLASLITGPYL